MAGDLLLLMRLEAPLQSWGTRARWDVRDTALEPTKSGVIGLIGCALGLRRGSPELEKLDEKLLFAVRVDHQGTLATDYQTATGYHRTAEGGYKHAGGVAKSLAKAKEHPENTIVSLRDYLHDARFLVVLSSADELLLKRLAGDVIDPGWSGSLRRPRWPLYLGRKSCVPTRPVLSGLTDAYSGLEDALRKERWRRPKGSSRETPGVLDGWIECGPGDPGWHESERLSERQDAIRVNDARFYGFRNCRYISIPTRNLHVEVA